MKMAILVGTYTEQGDSRGIYEIALDMETGRLSDPELIIRQKNPSYLTVSEDGRRIYAVEETFAGGRIFSYRLGSSGWEETGCELSGGSAPCHLLLDGNLLAAANYLNGAVSFFTLKDGAVSAGAQVLRPEGGSVDPVRQECTHAHQCVRYGNSVLVCDLGSDRVRVFSPAGNEYRECGPLVVTRPGSGPRHLVFSRDGTTLFVLCEIQNVLYAFGSEGGGFAERGVYEYLPPDTPQSFAGAIRISGDGRYLFASSRGGYNGVALFTLERGRPALRGLYPTAAFPRDILPVGPYLLCACQTGGALQVFRHKGDALTLVDAKAFSQPTCLALKGR